MVAVANPDELDAKARQLRTEAKALDKAVDPLARSARGATWQGRAALQFQSDAGEMQKSATSAASELRAAASAMETGATHIRQYLARLKQIELEQKQGHMAGINPI